MEHPSGLSPDIFTYYFSHHSKEDLIFMSDNQNNIQLPEHGKLTIPMTNDYLFRALLQQNNKVLTGLIASLLHLSPSEISSVEITNPIVLGESINDKTFFLDIRVNLNQNTLINLEMQVINEHNWPERSLSYLCREFDQLSTGQSYELVKPVISTSGLPSSKPEPGRNYICFLRTTNT